MSRLIDELKEWGCDVDVAMDRFIQDEDLYISCLEKFIDDASFGQLKICLEEKNYEETFNHAHTLKGVAANLGLDPLFACISSMVEDLRVEKYDQLEKQLAEIDKAHARFCEIMA